MALWNFPGYDSEPRGRQRLTELYYEYGDLTRSLPYTMDESE